MSNADGTNGTSEEIDGEGTGAEGTEERTGTQPLPTVVVSPEAGIPDEEVDDGDEFDPELAALEAEFDEEARANLEATTGGDENVFVGQPQRVEHHHFGEVRHVGPVEHFHHFVGGCEGDFAAARPVEPTPKKEPTVTPMRPTSSSVPVSTPVRRSPAGNGNGGRVNDTSTGADDGGFKAPGWVWPLLGFFAILLLAFLAWNSRDRTPPPVPPAPVEEEEVVINIVEDNLVDVCEIAPAFALIDPALQAYWQDFGPQDTAPSCVPLERTPEHIPCMEYRQWHRNVRYCQYLRADNHAARVISNAGLD